MNKGIIAIGGGNLQHGQTLTIDKKIVSLTGKDHPKVLFFPTASKDDQGYAKRFKQYYRTLGCEVSSLRLFHTKLTNDELADLLLQQDILYFGGGDTTLLRDTICEKSLDDVLRKAYHQGILLAGYSAGANLMFQYGYSETPAGLSFVEGLGIVPGAFTPHAQLRECFFEKATSLSTTCIACADGQAYFWIDEQGSYLP